MKLFTSAALAAFLMMGVSVVAEDAAAAKSPKSVHELTMKSLAGGDVNMKEFAGKVLLMVNVASECGATPQYEQLQALHEKYGEKGLVVMGFPCNQFGAQEPGTADEIRQFCTSKYSVKFPMFAKIDVNGDKQSPLYEFLKSNADDHSNIGWNFEKFIVSKDGKVAARFKTRTKPDAPEVIQLIEEELAK